ncbi:asparagine synthase (glutamine-hydrolyzing) [Butyrivibrio sp. MC2013]|uniref:asparagine synthase (glutamine-hydrolyzing) n=1 Tax=Butyrivibrio sp. MC2013 TaxID=1280686 RepID=UPI0004000527|nr:asparagine synthase (glutamine-hydrolyzing) [Butyrivibrio sp. MC2013]
MCGIAGLIGYKGDGLRAIAAMNERMKDRGPDAGGIWQDEEMNIFLGHRRLAIRDLSESGAQPMVSASGRFVMVYNGEIYNSDELKDKLISDGYMKASDFRSESDTEVLLEAAEAYGLYDTLRFCKGMFAIALYDRKEHVLSLARDRAGEKPLYYGFCMGGCFAFASNIACFREIEGFNNRICRDILPVYFSHGYIPAPYSIYENIYKLLPGTILTIREPFDYFDPVADGDLESYYGHNRSGACFFEHKVVDAASDSEIEHYLSEGPGHIYRIYWSMEEAARRGRQNPFRGSMDEAVLETKRLLKEAIRGQMISDVPLGAFLSAGIDSPTIVSLMQEVSPARVRTFTIGMNDPRYNEAEIAGEIAAILGTDHTRMDIDDKDARAVIPMIPDIFGEPFGDSSQIPTYLVSKLTRQHVTVSLSGDAGDELFGGYLSYGSAEHTWNSISRLPYIIRRPLGSLAEASLGRGSDVWKAKGSFLQAIDERDLHMRKMDPMGLGRALYNGDGKAPLYAGSIRAAGLGDVITEARLIDMSMYHPDDILVKVDRTAMAVSLESRVPLLDRDLMEFAWSLPGQYLRKGDTGKLILRQLLSEYVPPEVTNRPKKGFSIPIGKWLRDGDLRSWADSLMDETFIRNAGYMDADAAMGIWRDYLRTGNWNPQIWHMLVFNQWLRKYER